MAGVTVMTLGPCAFIFSPCHVTTTWCNKCRDERALSKGELRDGRSLLEGHPTLYGRREPYSRTFCRMLGVPEKIPARIKLNERGGGSMVETGRPKECRPRRERDGQPQLNTFWVGGAVQNLNLS